jgi:hypothetical protein
MKHRIMLRDVSVSFQAALPEKVCRKNRKGRDAVKFSEGTQE